jgi:hypothetical protein
MDNIHWMANLRLITKSGYYSETVSLKAPNNIRWDHVFMNLAAQCKGSRFGQ